MDVKVSSNVSYLHEIRQRPVFGGLQFARVLPELRWYVSEAESGVDLRLRRDGLVLSGPGLRQPVLGDVYAHPHGSLPEDDVVGLTPSEVVQERAERLGRHDPEIHLDPPTLDKNLRRAVSQNLVHELGPRECVGQSFPFPARGDEVEVADGLLPAPQRTRDLPPPFFSRTPVGGGPPPSPCPPGPPPLLPAPPRHRRPAVRGPTPGSRV